MKGNFEKNLSHKRFGYKTLDDLQNEIDAVGVKIPLSENIEISIV